MPKEDFELYLNSTRCDENVTTNKVCCDKLQNETDWPNPPCGRSVAKPKITDGQDTDLDDFRWMVLLEYKDRKQLFNHLTKLLNQIYLI